MPERRQPAAVTDLAQRLHALAIHLLRRARREDIAMGLPPGQASALSVLVFGGAKTMSELASIEQVRAPTMTRIIAALESGGFVRRTADPGDRRKAQIAATPAGTRVMHAGRARRVAVLTQLLGDLDGRERTTLASALAMLERLQRR